jgi:Carboxypeptidase regulatory-like domain
MPAKEKSTFKRRSQRHLPIRAVLLPLLFIFLAGTADLNAAQVIVAPRRRYSRPVPTGSISGMVTLADGTPAVKARVMVQTSDGNSPRTTTTDSKGHFRVKDLRRGPYDLRARAGDTWSVWKRHVRVRINEETTITLSIPPPGSPPAEDRPAKKSRQRPAPHAS